MRNNLPVTGTERFLGEGEFILSQADMQGNITYMNRTFIEMSGYSEAELRNQPHNILRHPDMPPEAFRDFWTTLKSGKSWSGLVKNRCKNGDHYWVTANATPMWSNGTITGYMSVRTRPDRKLVESAETLYRQMRNKETKATLSDGRIMLGGLKGLLQRLDDMTIKKRMGLVFTATLVLWLMVGFLGWSGIADGENDLREVVEQRMEGNRLITAIEADYAVDIIDAVNKTNAGIMTAEAANAGIDAAIKRIDKNWAALNGLDHSPAAQDLLEKASAQMKKADADIVRLQTALSVLNGAAPGRLNAFDGSLYRSIDPIGSTLNQVFDIKNEAAKQSYIDAMSLHTAHKSGISILILLGAILIAYMLFRTYKVIVLPVERVRKQMIEITNGNLSLAVESDRRDEIGDMTDAFKSMFVKLRFDMADTRRVADEAERMGFALASVSTPVTVSNEQNNLIYLNQAARQLFEGIYGSGSAVDALLNKPITESLDDPELKRITFGKLDQAKAADGILAGRNIRLSTRPVVDKANTYLGRVCQWNDRTLEVRSEEQVSFMVEAASSGDFSQRIETKDKSGFFLALANNLNDLVEATGQSLEDVVRVLNALAKGDLTQTIDREYRGTFAQMKTDANATVAQLKEIITTITEATDAINGAAKEIAAGNADLSRRTESQAASLEETASSTEELTNTVRNNADNATTASQLARTSSEVADRGGRVVSEVVVTMGAIADSSSKIAEIINVIDGIAFQTNILALNAAVEAARAGEQGRGFAVVAGEVRNLAQRSASAAKEIKELISESVAKVSNGYKLVETAGQTMQEIVSSTQQVASIMNDISSASEEQRTGIMQLNSAITSMDETTQQNAALVEEAAAAAQSLEDQSGNLTEAVGVFRIDGRERGSSRKVERLPVRPVMKAAAYKAPAKPKAVGGSAAAQLDDEWEEF